MDLRSRVVSWVLMVIVLRGGAELCSQLSYDHYQTSCPEVEQIVKAGLAPFFLSDPTSPAALLRLMFHDCQVQGCDASILTDPGEMASSKNYGIRKREVIESVKSLVETNCPGQVSCSDILVLVAREAVAVTGGPLIRVPLGRKDTAFPSSVELAEASLPAATAGVDEMLRLFADKGMTLEESVAIIGAHTLGVTHCRNVVSRLRSSFPMKPTAQTLFEAYLRQACTVDRRSFLLTPNSTSILNDPTAVVFDNVYYVNAVEGRGVLRIDADVTLDPRTGPVARIFARDKEQFFREFSSAFVKLSCSGVVTGSPGVIRRRCNEID